MWKNGTIRMTQEITKLKKIALKFKNDFEALKFTNFGSNRKNFASGIPAEEEILSVRMWPKLWVSARVTSGRMVATPFELKKVDFHQTNQKCFERRQRIFFNENFKISI